MTMIMNDVYSFVKYGDPCLDFVNSKVWNTRVQPFTDLFVDYEHIVHWFRHLAILDDEEVLRLLEISKSNLDMTQKAFENIVKLRDTNHRILTSLSHQASPSPQDLERLNGYYSDAMKHRQLMLTPEGMVWIWVNKEDALDWMLWPIAYSTAELLSSERVLRVRECNGCYWMFMDTSRNGLRRWCDMKTCGNRAKAHRQYERAKATNS
ncbi:hypothetical protein EG832_10855 [bacterium]|nr:hypothetical protein [bacterium]